MHTASDRFTALTKTITAFARERGWNERHDPKSLLLALVGEVGELSEILQWLTPEEAAHLAEPTAREREHLREEMADIFIYLIELAAVLDIELIEAAQDKIVKNSQKHPLRGNGV